MTHTRQPEQAGSQTGAGVVDVGCAVVDVDVVVLVDVVGV